MSKEDFSQASSGFSLCLLTAAVVCLYAGGCVPTAKYERIVNLSAPLPAGSLFEAKTHNGYINITGADVTECSVTATITARANTEENAKKLAEKVEVKLIPSGNGLAVKIEKPKSSMGKKVSVSLDVNLPSQINTRLTTHNGALKITNLTGSLNGTTHNGKVTADKISGTAELKTHNGKIVCKEAAGNTKLQTHNGSITCEEISGDIKLKTHNGSAKAFYAETASPVCDISIVTHNGSVSLTTPPNLSAKIDASTHNGSINTDLPITITGTVKKKKLTGTIGTGRGQLYLETHNGSINLK